METHIHMILIKNGHTLEKISGSYHLKRSGNTTSGSEITTENAFLTITPLIIIIDNFPLICQ